MTFHMEQLIPTLVLGAAVVDDLATRKVHNWLFLAAAVFGVLNAAFFHNSTAAETVFTIFGGFGTALALALPAVLFGILGAGDMKILAAFGIAAGSMAVLDTFLYSIVWGALIGLLQVALSGRLKILGQNLVGIVTRSGTRGTDQLHRIPYTVALFFGWMSFLVAGAKGGFL